MTSPLVTGGYLALKSKLNSKYVRYMPQQSEGKTKSLQVSGQDAVSPYTRFQAEPSKKHEGLVHMRCCYNSKYWVAREVNGVWCLFGDANEPEEDLSKPSCTLFRHQSTSNGDSKDNYTQLIHSKLVGNVYVASDSEATRASLRGCLLLGDVDKSKEDAYMFSLINLDKHMVLPKHVCFKGDNDLYGVILGGINKYLEFSSDDIGHPAVSHTVHVNEDGTVRIMSDYFNTFWRRDPNWIKADSPDTTSKDPETLFRAVKLGDTSFALQSLGNNMFCKRLTADDKESCLNAGVSTITKEAMLQLEEAVLSRKIYDVDYHLMEAKVYDQKVITMATAKADNQTSSEHKAKMTLNYSETKERKWDSSVSLKLGVKTTIEAGVPEVASASIELETEFTESYTWGKSEEITEKHSVDYEIIVPAKTMMKLRVLATQGTCDVPFSYFQEDVLTTGEKVVSKFDDGIYHGVNSYDFTYEVTEEKL